MLTVLQSEGVINMSVRLRGKAHIAGSQTTQVYGDYSFNQRETTVDGYTFHWGVNETRNFLDDNVGLRHAAFVSGDDACAVDTIPFGDERS